MTNRANRLEGRRRLWLTSGVALIVLASAVGIAMTRDSAPPTTEPVPTTTTSEPGVGNTQPPAGTTVPLPAISEEPIPQEGNPNETCTAIRVRLQEYRDVAAASTVTTLTDLSLRLEEFEHEIDFLGQGSDWSIAMVEQIFQVRRDWITASSAAEAGDQEESGQRRASALALLDQAISVECPPS